MLEAKDLKWKNAVVRAFRREELTCGDITLTLEPTRTLNVLVRDSKGNPLKGAEVFTGATHRPTIESEFTNENGVATFDYMFVGAAYPMPRVWLDGYYNRPVKDTFIVNGDGWQDQLEIVMEDARRTQTGIVVDEDGKPLPGVRVRCSDTGNETVTDSEGRFALEALPDSEVTIFASTQYSTGIATVSAETPDIEIRIRQLGDFPLVR